jgi:hypothetical protein
MRIWIEAGMPTRTKAEQEAILEICKACPLYKPHKNPDRAGRCGKCGCRLNINGIGGKLQMATESCPDSPPRWGTESVKVAQESTPQGGDQVSTKSLGGFLGAEIHPEPVPPAKVSRREARAARIARRNARKAMREGYREDKAEQEAKLAAEPPEAKQGRQEARRERIMARQSRINRRKAERLAMGGETPPRAVVPETVDPLLIFGRNGGAATDALRGLWHGCAAFYVCGGPSLKKLDLGFLRERGIVSLGINNVGGYAPVRAWTFSDPASKFHHGIFFDPSIIKFVPRPKLSERVRAKLPDGSFQWTPYEVRDCPSVFAYDRYTKWRAEDFLTTEQATWGPSAKHAENKNKPTTLSTFFLGLRLLHYLGVKRVYLLGVDFHMDANAHYAFGQDRAPGAQASNSNAYRVVSGLLTELRPVLDRAGFEVYQTNRESALKVFDYVPLADAIDDCRGLVPREPWPADSFAGWYEKPKLDGDDGEDDRGE